MESATRHGARVTKHYEAPLTPLERVLRSTSVPQATRQRLQEEFRALDPVELLRRMREAQRHVAECSAAGSGVTATKAANSEVPIEEFLTSLSTAWQAGEVRPTHGRKAASVHDWRTRSDPFADTWPKIQQWLETEPGVSAQQLQKRLTEMMPELYSGAQLRTLQRRVKAWRTNRARELVTRTLGADAVAAAAATRRQPPPQNNPKATITPE